MRPLAAFCALFALPGAAFAQSPVQKPFFSKQILLGAHRGGADQWPENTLYGFQEAAKAVPGVLLETDARLTADGEVVLLHDKTLDRTTDGTGDVTAKTLAEVKALDAAYRFTTDSGATFPLRGKGITVPTLKEVLDALPDSHILVDLKGDAPLADAAIAVMRACDAEGRVLLASFVPSAMDRARQLAPDMAYCYDMKNGAALLMALRGPAWDAYVPAADVLSVDEDMIPQHKLTADEIKRMQAKGIRFQVHTINAPSRMKEYVVQGVDSILTDNPSVLAKVIDESTPASK